MRILRALSLGLALLALVRPGHTLKLDDTPYQEGTILVRFERPPGSALEAGGLLGDGRLLPVRELVPALGIWQFGLKDGWSVPQALAELEDHPLLRWVQADHKLELRTTLPNDPSFGSQWALNNTGQSGVADADIDAPEAWDLGTGGVDPGGAPIVVAVVDGGMELVHANLAPNLWVNSLEAAGTAGVDDDGNGYVDDINGWDAYAGDGSIPSHGHGTHVAGIVGARGNDASQVCGVNWNVGLMPVAASSSTTSVVAAGYNYVLAQKTRWVQSGGIQGANVVATNSSFGVDLANCQSGNYPIWNDLYTALGQVGVLSAGATANANYNVDTQGDVPTSCTSDWLITVTNTTSGDVKYSGAGYGATSIDLGAPGTSVLSTYTGNSTSSLSGTSMATPHVAGAIAFLHSVASPAFHQLYLSDPAQAALVIKQTILATVDVKPALQGITVSGGRLNLAAAAQAIASYGVGMLSGVVSDASTGQPVAGASLTAQPGGASALTGAAGAYQLALEPGSYTVNVAAAGYQAASQLVAMPAEGGVSVDWALVPMPPALLSGVVLDGQGLPLAGATVTVAGTAGASQTTGLDGLFQFELPTGGTYTVTSRAAGGELMEPQGPDNHGYRAFDAGDADWCRQSLTLDPGGAWLTLQGANRAAYQWTTLDPSQGGPGSELAFSADDQTLALALPFTFRFYGQDHSALSVCGNGWLAFGSTSSTEYRGQAIPTAGAPNGLVAALWEDLSPQVAASGAVSHWHDVVGGRFILEFNHIRQYSPDTAFEDFQIILLDPALHPTQTGDGAILVQWRAIGELDNATVGIENPAGTGGLQYFYGRGNGTNTVGGTLPASNASPAAGLAVLFTTGMLPSLAPPAAVQDLAIQVDAGVAQLAWTAVPGASAYRVESAPAAGGSWSSEGVAVGTSWTGVAGQDAQRLYRVVALD